MDVSSRLFRLLRAVAEDKATSITKIIDQGNLFLDENLREWEKKFGLDENEDFTGADDFAGSERNGSRTGTRSADYPRQLMEDLQLFNLTPPSSLEEVKSARNREIKKFHPDKYLNDPEKMETANQIVQIYNAAYERLKNSLGGKS
ncbi:MAG: J domain-containing protein [Proteobacteria bacterium]|nr:J domain-containing protein [Pseudomonadota bacterium]